MTYTTFYDNLAALSVLDVKKNFTYPPGKLERSDLPVMWAQLPEGQENAITFQTHGGWPLYTAQVVIAIESTGQKDRKYNYADMLRFMDNLAEALRGAGQTIAPGKLVFVIRPGLATLADEDYWSVIAEVAIG